MKSTKSHKTIPFVMNGYIDQVAVYPLYKTNDNIHVPKNNSALLSVNNLSSPNSSYLDKGFLKTSFDTAIRFLSRFVAMCFYNQISIQSFRFFLREAKS